MSKTILDRLQRTKRREIRKIQRLLRAYRRALRRIRGGDVLELRFTEVYEENLWTDDESRSGLGSRLDSVYVAISLATLERVVEEHNIRSINDIPCGDFNWMWKFVDARPEISYRGFDIVPTLIKENRRKAPKRQFDVLNIATTVPPQADLVFCKDLLNHLTFDDVSRAIENIARSGSKLLLASNSFAHPNVELQRNSGGQSRDLDISEPPFSYPKPIWHSEYLGLWDLADIRAGG